ncbi:MAG: quinone-dependent dihydroorotate dehydrogenase [Saprospiraceae bacterium]
MLYAKLLKPLLFRLSPEKAHHLTVRLLELALSVPGVPAFMKNLYSVRHTALQRQCFGLSFPNPVGLAAGFDKDGRYFKAMSHLGFGFIEIGTVTPRPQGGNPQPRLFRLPDDGALINRMGFNNEGVDALVERLKAHRPSGLVIGGNIGKNKDTPNEEAANDYLICFDKLFDYVDYFVVNVSSPNTPNLRDLQEKEPLTKLLQTLQDRNQQYPSPKPILLKIAPDLTDGQLDDIIDISHTTQLAGIIATNTTIQRAGLQTPVDTISHIGAGGLSGAPLKQRATEVIRYLHQRSHGQIPIIGVGGISSPADAREKLAAGACLVQVYSGLVYAGPSLVRDICKTLVGGRS